MCKILKAVCQFNNVPLVLDVADELYVMDAGRVIADGETVRFGDLQLTAIATPGHTPGALSWRWESCDGGVCRTMVFADSPLPRLGTGKIDRVALKAQYAT